jgi:hypothetical protein
LRDIVRDIPAFNVTGNTAFDQLHQHLSSPGSLANFTPEQLRSNPELKTLAVQQAGVFLDQLSDIFGPPAAEAPLEDAA